MNVPTPDRSAAEIPEERLAVMLRARAMRGDASGMAAAIMAGIADRPQRRSRWALRPVRIDRRPILGIAAVLLAGSLVAAVLAGFANRQPRVDAGPCAPVEAALTANGATDLPDDVAKQIQDFPWPAVQAPSAGGLTALGPGPFMTSPDVLRLDPTSGTVTSLASIEADVQMGGAPEAAWSPSGRAMAVTVADEIVTPACSEIALLSEDGSHVYRVVRGDDAGHWVQLGWSPSGESFAATRWDISGHAPRGGRLHVVKLRGRQDRDLGIPCSGCIVGSIGGIPPAAWAPDAAEIAVKYSRAGQDDPKNPKWGLAVVSVESGAWRILTDAIWNDVTVLDWGSTQGDLGQRYRGQITFAAVVGSGVFVDGVEGGHPAIFSTLANGSAAPIEVTASVPALDGQFDGMIAPDPAGTSFAVTGQHGGELMVTTLSGPPHDVWSEPNTWITGAAWSPNGEQLAFQVIPDKPGFPDTAAIWVVDKDGTGLRQVGSAGALLDWQPIWK